MVHTALLGVHITEANTRQLLHVLVAHREVSR